MSLEDRPQGGSARDSLAAIKKRHATARPGPYEIVLLEERPGVQGVPWLITTAQKDSIPIFDTSIGRLSFDDAKFFVNSWLDMKKLIAVIDEQNARLIALERVAESAKNVLDKISHKNMVAMQKAVTGMGEE